MREIKMALPKPYNPSFRYNPYNENDYHKWEHVNNFNKD